jgi:SAM-dependent methyltransferase
MDDPTRGMKTERLTAMANAFKNAGTLLACVELGIFSAIAEGAGNVAQISERTNIPEESVDRLLTVCRSLKLVDRIDGEYRNYDDVQRYLVKSSRTYYGDFLVYDSKKSYDGWKELAREIQGSGGPIPPRSYFAMMADPEAARKFTVAGYNASISLAHKFAKMFDFSPYRMWLDFAGGSGCYSIAACERYPDLRTVVIDQANVVPVTKEFVAKHHLQDRIQARVGNFLEPDYPRGFDLISFITPLQAYMPDDLNRIFSHTFQALEPGGTILIIDFMLNEDKTGPLDPALMNLQMIRGGHYAGRVNTGSEFEGFLSKVGFENTDYWWLMPHQLGVVTAKKPG